MRAVPRLLRRAASIAEESCCSAWRTATLADERTRSKMLRSCAARFGMLHRFKKNDMFSRVGRCCFEAQIMCLRYTPYGRFEGFADGDYLRIADAIEEREGYGAHRHEFGDR